METEIAKSHDDALNAALASMESEIKASDVEGLKSDIAAFTESAEGDTDESTPVETKEAEPVVEEKKDDSAVTRLAEREEALRTKEAEFDKRVEEAVARKLPKFEKEDDVLEHFGFDKELYFKKVLFENAKDGPLKEQLKQDLKDYHTNKKIKDLEASIKAKEEAAANQEFYNKVVQSVHSDLKTVDEKSLGTISKLVKAGKSDYVHAKVLSEISKDAQEKMASGKGGSLLTNAEAMKRVEEDLKVLAEVFKDSTVKAPAKESKPSIGSPVATKTIKKPQLTHDQVVELAIKQAQLDLMQ